MGARCRLALTFAATLASCRAEGNEMAFAIKAEVRDARANAFTFVAQKTMY